MGQKPKVFIYTDMSDSSLPGPNKEGTINDPDDISAMAAYLLMCNMFDTKGIVVASTHRSQHKETPDQAVWARSYFGLAYANDLKYLNTNIGGYPEKIDFMESCIKKSAERYDPKKKYASLEEYTTVETLFQVVEGEEGVINVLCWGSLTEPAIFVNHCLLQERYDVLEKIRIIAHWTNSPWHQGSMEHPEDVANCREDALACEYLKSMALNGHVSYYECGAIGQHGIVSGSPKGKEYFDLFRVSELGKIFMEGKFVFESVDHSDAATYWSLLGDWGVSLSDIRSNGTNFPEVEKANSEKFESWSERIHDELLRRCLAAGQSN